ncbi:MAG: response regulator [Verrucomicrobia bacterium]|nr:response regulator [Verrucomicrobiota bacterium]
MSAPHRAFRVSLEAKVMAAVLTVLIALPAITLWIMNDRMSRQMEIDARLALAIAHNSFVRSLNVRTDALAARFHTGINDPRFLRIVRLGDAPTMEEYLRSDVLEGFSDDTELALFVTVAGDQRGARRKNAAITREAFATAADAFVRTALQGEERTGSVAVNGRVYHVVAIPVAPPEGLKGALVFGIHISDAALQKIKPTASEVVVLAGDRIAAATLNESQRDELLLRQLVRAAAAKRSADVQTGLVTVGGERYLPVAGILDAGAASPGVRYVLLSSGEQRLRTLEQTRMTLLGLSGAGILVCAALVWFFVRRITRPLTALRGSAEAVGRGDFSHRIERFSNDEFGELAVAFNHMTTSLQSSRAELERAMQQVRTTQNQLIQSEKLSAVGQFVAGVAHELNNPLTAVVGFSELLQGVSTDEKTRSHLNMIAKSAHRCHKIVQNLLSFARQHEPERRLIGLHTIVDEVLEIMAYDLRTSDITVVREFAAQLPPIMADAHQLQQVFVNILGNARQAIEPVQRGGRIVIRTRQAADQVVIEFQDNGPGIRAEHLARIFDPFFTTKPVGKGTGLGLSLCYGIIQEHGGTISARSESGQGATFAIELPVAAQPQDPPAILRGDAPSLFPAAGRPASGKTVLVIDDEEWILELAGELLRGEGHRVETALGGQRALELIGRRKFDVIVSDWKMSGLNGVRLYEHLRATDPEAANRVLFMTGDVVNDTFQDFLRENKLACLSKPFATGEFRAAVAKIFATAGK